MHQLIGKMVEVEANEVTYSGRLVEMNETEVHLETEMGWIVIMNDNINAIREREE